MRSCGLVDIPTRHAIASSPVCCSEPGFCSVPLPQPCVRQLAQEVSRLVFGQDKPAQAVVRATFTPEVRVQVYFALPSFHRELFHDPPLPLLIGHAAPGNTPGWPTTRSDCGSSLPSKRNITGRAEPCRAILSITREDRGTGSAPRVNAELPEGRRFQSCSRNHRCRQAGRGVSPAPAQICWESTGIQNPLCF